MVERWSCAYCPSRSPSARAPPTRWWSANTTSSTASLCHSPEPLPLSCPHVALSCPQVALSCPQVALSRPQVALSCPPSRETRRADTDDHRLELRATNSARSRDCCTRDGSWTYIMWPAG